MQLEDVEEVLEAEERLGALGGAQRQVRGDGERVERAGAARVRFAQDEHLVEEERVALALLRARRRLAQAHVALEEELVAAARRLRLPVGLDERLHAPQLLLRLLLHALRLLRQQRHEVQQQHATRRGTGASANASASQSCALVAWRTYSTLEWCDADSLRRLLALKAPAEDAEADESELIDWCEPE